MFHGLPILLAKSIFTSPSIYNSTYHFTRVIIRICSYRWTRKILIQSYTANTLMMTTCPRVIRQSISLILHEDALNMLLSMVLVNFELVEYIFTCPTIIHMIYRFRFYKFNYYTAAISTLLLLLLLLFVPNNFFPLFDSILFGFHCNEFDLY